MKGYPFVVVTLDRRLLLITAIVKVLLSTYTEKIFILKRFKHVYTAVCRKLSWDTLAQSIPNTVSVTMLLRVYIRNISACTFFSMLKKLLDTKKQLFQRLKSI